MSAAPVIEAMSALPAKPRPFVNLLAKELRESRGSLAVGAFIFGLVPMFWGLLYLWMAHEWGMAFGLIMAMSAGWLYALAFGAQVVCRDLGRPQEWFLLARPVSTRAVVAAKLLAGGIVLAAVWCLAAGSDWLVYLCAKVTSGASHPNDSPVPLIVLSVLPMAASYLLAFGFAVLTRQTLAAALFAGLTLAAWMAAPLIWQPLLFLYPRWAGGADGSWAFTLAYAVCVAACTALAFWAAAREQAIRLGHKGLAWAVAAVVLALFAGAMHENGNSLSVVDAVEVKAAAGWGKESPWGWPHWWLVASQGEHCLGIAQGHFLDSVTSDLKVLRTELIHFRVDAQGRIRDLRRAPLWFDPTKQVRLANGPTIHHMPIPSFEYIARLDTGPTGEFVVTGASIRGSLIRMRLVWPASQEPRVVSWEESQVPVREQRSLALVSFSLDAQGALALYADGTEAGPPVPKLLCRLDWTPDPKEGETPVPLSNAWGPLTAEYKAAMAGGGRSWHAARFVITANDHWLCGGYSPVVRPDQTLRTGLEPIFGQPWPKVPKLKAPQLAWDLARPLVYVADSDGVRVVETLPGGGTEQRGQYQASVLSRWLRGQSRQLEMVGGSRLAELGSSALSLFDMTNPGRPRRLGFHNLSGSWGMAQVFVVNGQLLLRQRLAANNADRLMTLTQPPEIRR